MELNLIRMLCLVALKFGKALYVSSKIENNSCTVVPDTRLH